MTNKISFTEKTIKEFDEKFLMDNGMPKELAYKGGYHAVKSFLKKALKDQRESILQSLPKEKTWGGYDGEGIVDDPKASAYNECLSDCRRAVENKKGESNG